MCDCETQKHFVTEIGGFRALVCKGCGKSSRIEWPAHVSEERGAWRFLGLAALLLAAALLTAAVCAWLWAPLS